jgi:hypothetical protein
MQEYAMPLGFPNIGNTAEFVGQVSNLRPIFNRPGRPRANAAQAG